MPTLFRGLGNDTWSLETTLERSFPMENSKKSLTFMEYYGKIAASWFALESLRTSERFPLPEPEDFKDTLSSKKSYQRLVGALGATSGLVEYLVYLARCVI